MEKKKEENTDIATTTTTTTTALTHPRPSQVVSVCLMSLRLD